MSSYRDSFDKCPRCGIALTDAASARGCANCGGVFVDEAVLSEMIQRMLPPGPLTRLQLSVLASAEAPIGCPSCGDKMEQTELMNVPIERCAKHGVWFDSGELGRALYRLTEPGAAPPMVELPVRQRVRPVVTTPTPQPIPAEGPRSLHVVVEIPGKLLQTVEVREEVVKIGRGGSSHIRIDDENVSRMHAVIEVSPEGVQIIDLGSGPGTIIDGESVTRRALQSGDQIVIGSASLTVTFAE